MRAVILAGGQGARLSPYTKVIPKPLIPIGDMPILEIILKQLRASGFDRATLAVSYKANMIENYFGNGHWLGLSLDYSYTSQPLGTSGPLSFITSLDDTFLVMNGDVLSSIDFADVYAIHRQTKSVATVVVCQHTIDVGFGVINVDSQARVLEYIEKPSLNMAICGGVYIFEPSVLQHIPHNQYMDMPTLIQHLIAQELPVHAYVFNGDWMDIGTITQYEFADSVFRRHRDRYLKSHALQTGPDEASEELLYSSPAIALQR
jgi:NDP-sugar pyrophosphorylase family protein